MDIPRGWECTEPDKIRYATEMIDAVKEFEEEQAADEDKEERKRREIESGEGATRRRLQGKTKSRKCLKINCIS